MHDDPYTDNNVEQSLQRAMAAPEPEDDDKKSIVMPIMMGSAVGGMFAIIMVFAVLIAPVLAITTAITKIPALGAVLGAACNVGANLGKLPGGLPFVDLLPKEKECWFQDLLDVAEEAGLSDELRVILDCSNATQRERDAGECDERAIDMPEDSPLPPEKEWLLRIYMQAADMYDVPWELIAATHGVRTNFGAENCVSKNERRARRDQYSGGEMRFSRAEWDEFGSERGWSHYAKSDMKDPVAGGEDRQCYTNDGKNIEIITTKNQVSNQPDPETYPADAVDSVYTIALQLKRNGAASEDTSGKDAGWSYTGGPAESCAPSYRIYPYTGPAAGGSAGNYAFVDTNPTKENVAAGIKAIFEAKGIPGQLGVAISLVETGGTLNPDARQPNGDYAVGLFQTFPKGAGGDQSHRAQLIRAHGARAEAVTKYYAASMQIEDASGWFASAAYGRTLEDADNFQRMADWAQDAQRAGVAYNSGHGLEKFTKAWNEAAKLTGGITVVDPTPDAGAVGGTNATAKLKGEYKGKKINWEKDVVSNAVRTRKGIGGNLDACYVAHVHDWYQAFVEADFYGGTGDSAISGDVVARLQQSATLQLDIPYYLKQPVRTTEDFKKLGMRRNSTANGSGLWDCSTFTAYVLYMAAGIKVNSYTDDQWTYSGGPKTWTPFENEKVVRGLLADGPPPGGYQPGDLLLFVEGAGSSFSGHVIIVFDKKTAIGAGNPVKKYPMDGYPAGAKGWIRYKQLSTAAAATAAKPGETVKRFISFPTVRKKQMAAYSRRHYGTTLGGFILKPKAIVLHYTDTPDAQTAIDIFEANVPDPELKERPGVCAHYLIDKDGTVYWLVPLNLRCRHAVGINYAAIGIEMVQQTVDGSARKADQQILARTAQINAALALVRSLQEHYGIPLENVVGHSQVTPQNIPKLYVDGVYPDGLPHSDWQPASVVEFKARL